MAVVESSAAAAPRLFDDRSVEQVETVEDLVSGVSFHPAVAEWFRRRFPHGPTPPQTEAWPHIAARRNTLIAAPTGSGKTLAGFLMAINRLYLDAARGDLRPGISVVYVSPLKALAVDIAENLNHPLEEVAALATVMGFVTPEISVGVRTGDTTASERARMSRTPPTFLVTTPESLYLMVTAEKSRATLATTETIIVDEIHALANDKRGAHLTLTLERLSHVCGGSPSRIGLSATQKPVETVASMLVGDRSASDGSADCVIVDAGHQRSLDLELVLPDGELEAVTSASQMDSVLEKIALEVRDHRTTLIFVNTRRMAERLAHQLGERLGDDVVSAHHGSLSKDRRTRVEHRLRAGELKALVATASLELGIDIGPVELVCQIGSPRAIATLLQRVGRSNHTRHGTPKGRLYPLTRDELVETAAMMLAVRAGRLDAVRPPVAPLDILSQQIIAECAAEDWTTDDLYALVRRAHHYRSLSRHDFDEVVQLGSEGIMTGRGRRAAYLHHDAINGEVRARKGARLAALTSGGAIPDIGDYRVIAEPDETPVGTVGEDWAAESTPGDIFLLGTHAWQIRRVTSGEVRVVDAGDRRPTVPFWLGEAPARTFELSEEVSTLRRTVDDFLMAADPGGATRWLVDEAGLGDAAAGTITLYLAAGRASLGVMPTHTDLVMERFFDESGGMQLVIHSPYGGRINRAMGYGLRKKFCRSFNFELQASASDDAVVISLGPHHSFPLSDVPRYLTTANIRETVTQAILDQPLFLSRWRWNLNRSLVVLRFRGGKKNPPPFQRMESDDMMAALFPGAAACQENITGPIEIPDHPLVHQTVHDGLTELLDVDGLIELWQRIGDGDVTFHFRDTTEPSLLAHEILTARPYAFLDDGEFIDRRTNAVPLRRGLPTDVGDIGRVDSAAIDRVRAEVEPNPTSADELHDLLTAILVAPPRDDWMAMFEALERRGRVKRRLTDDGEIWHTTERSGRVDVLFAGASAPDITREEVAADVLRGHLDVSGPLTAEQLSRQSALAPSLTAIGLATLEAEGFALQGRFSDPDGTGDVEYCSRRLLARIHSYSRTRRRRSIEPVTPATFMRFLTRWHHVAPGSRLRGIAGLEVALDQLQGHEAPLAAWEPDILAARVSDYRPDLLDRLCHSGSVSWLRLAPPPLDDPNRRTAGPSKATPVSLVNRDDLDWMLAAFRSRATPPVPERGPTADVIESLTSDGAQFLSELVASTGRMPNEIEEAVWDGVARGLLTSDGFEAARSLSSGRRTAPRQHRSLSRIRRAPLRPTQSSGRWSLVGDPPILDEPDDLAEAAADLLLARWGVVFYDLAATESIDVPWRDIQWALRRLEDRGLVRGGHFVKGFSGEQFALPRAVEMLSTIRRSEPTGRTITLNATDPLNLTGVILPGARVPARRTETVTLDL